MQEFIDWLLYGYSIATWYEWAFLISTSLYVFLILFLTIGSLFNPKTTESSEAPTTKVTVLVSGRNEERDFPDCIDSILKLDYPKELLQIVLVDDLSTDGTRQLIDNYAHNHSNVVALHTKDLPDNGLEAKGRGIAHGFDVATGEWVFITDADAIVHPKWIKHSLHGVDESQGIIGGALVVNPVGFVGKIERISWAFVQLFNLGMAGWGVPFACVGPNIIIRRSIYENAGGLENANFDIAEDLALMEMSVKAGYKVRTLFSEETTVQLKPVPSFRHLISQQRRWFRGGIDQGKDFYWILWIAFSWGFFSATWYWFAWLLNPQLYISLVIFKPIVEFTFLSIQKKRLKQRKYVRYMLILQIYLPLVFQVFIPSFLFTKKIKWMGDDYSIDFK